MSIADFGSTVEEVQQKLNENLPHIYQGTQQSSDLVERLNSEAIGWKGSLETIADWVQRERDLVQKFETSYGKLEQQVEEAWSQADKRLDDFTGQADTVTTKLEAARESVENDVQQGTASLSGVIETSDQKFGTIKESARSLLDTLQKSKEGFTGTRDQLIQQMNTRIDQHNELHPPLKTKIAKLIESDIPIIDSEFVDGLELWQAMGTSFKEGASKAVDEARDEFIALVNDTEKDADAMLQEYLQKITPEYEQLASEVETAGNEATEAVRGFGSYVSERATNEALETRAVSQTATTFAEEIAGLPDKVQAANQTADTMNTAL